VEREPGEGCYHRAGKKVRGGERGRPDRLESERLLVKSGERREWKARGRIEGKRGLGIPFLMLI